jgi:hypothetical protein
MKTLAIAVGLSIASAGAAFALDKPAEKFTALRSIQAPKALGDQELAKIEGQAITTQVLNPGGQTPQGGGATNGQAITVQAVNPAGHAPAGQNK